MKVFEFRHDEGVKASCCNYRTMATYWMADSREEAEKQLEAHGRGEPHGNCGRCLAELLAEEDYRVVKNE